MATTKVKLPPPSDFDGVKIPEFERKYVRKQGPASMKDGKPGRTFSAGGPKADLVARIIFADRGYTRAQIATIAGCSPSRVTEIIWALEEHARKNKDFTFPAVPRSQVTEEPAKDDAKTS